MSYLTNTAPVRQQAPKVALIDDDITLLTIFKSYLEAEYTVITFNNADSARTFLSQEDVDLVISDINMPGMNGLSLRKILAGSPNTDILPFIFLTAQKDESIQNQASVMGIDDYLIKPIQKSTLLQVCNRVLRRTRRVHARLGDRLDSDITSALRPQLPESFGHYRAIVKTRTACTGGGDFITCRKSGDDYFMILGDIMGHGINAKFFAHAHAGYLRGITSAMDMETSPASSLQTLSECIKSDSVIKNTTVTCIALSMKPYGKISMACAGHPPPFIVGPGALSTINVGGALPGLIPGYQYTESNITLKKNQRLIIYTDGLYEAVESVAGQARLEQEIQGIFRDTHNCSLDIVGQSVMDKFDEYTGGFAEDDATLILLERL